MAAKSLVGSLLAITIATEHEHPYKFPVSFPLSFNIPVVFMSIASRSTMISNSAMFTNSIQTMRSTGSCIGTSVFSGRMTGTFPLGSSCSAYSTLSGILKGNFNLSGTLSGTSSSSGWTTHIIAITVPTISAYSIFNATIWGSYSTTGSISASNSIGPSTILGNFKLISSVSATNSIGPSTILGNFSLHGSVSALGTVAPSTILGDFKLGGSISATNIINPITPIGIFSSTSICSASSSLTGSLRKNIYSSLFSTSSLSASIKGSFATYGTCIGGSSLSGGLKKNIYSTLISNSLLSSVAMGDFSVSSACSTTSSLFGSVLGNFRLVSFISATNNIGPSTILGSFSASSFISAISIIGPSTIFGNFRLIGSISSTNTIGPTTILGAFKLVSSISAVGGIGPTTILGSISSSGTCIGATTLTANATGYYSLIGSCRSNTVMQSILYKLLSGSSYTFSQVFLPGLQFPMDFPLLFTNDIPITVSMQCSGAILGSSSSISIISKALKVSLLMTSYITANATGAFSLSGACTTTSQIITNITGSFPLVGSINATGVITPTSIKGSFSINGIIAAVSTIGPPTITGSFSSTGSCITSSYMSSPIRRIISGVISSTSSLSATCLGLFSVSGNLLGATSNMNVVASRIITSTISSNSVMSASIVGSFSLIGSISSDSTLTDSKLDVSILVNPVIATSVVGPTTILGSFKSMGSISSMSNVNAVITGIFGVSGTCSNLSTLNSTIIGLFNLISNLSSSSTLSVNKALKLIGGLIYTQSSIGIRNNKPLSFPLTFPLDLYSSYLYITSTLRGTCSGTSVISATKLDKSIFGIILGDSYLVANTLGQFGSRGTITSSSSISGTILGNLSSSGSIFASSTMQGKVSPVRWIDGNTYSYSSIEITPIQLLEFPLDFPLTFTSMPVTQSMWVNGHTSGLSYMSAGVSRVLFGNMISESYISADTKMSINARGIISTLSISSARLSNFKGNVLGSLFTTSSMYGIINRHVELISNTGGISQFLAFLSRQLSISSYSIAKSNIYANATIRSATIKVQLKTTINNNVFIPYGVNIITHNSFIKKSPARIMVASKLICTSNIHRGIKVVLVRRIGLRRCFSVISRLGIPFPYKENTTVEQHALDYNITKWGSNKSLVIRSNYLSYVKSKSIY